MVKFMVNFFVHHLQCWIQTLRKGGGRAGSFRPLDKGEGGRSRVFGPQFGLKISGGGGRVLPLDPPLIYTLTFKMTEL